jgi:hypothetical protein
MQSEKSWSGKGRNSWEHGAYSCRIRAHQPKPKQWGELDNNSTRSISDIIPMPREVRLLRYRNPPGPMGANIDSFVIHRLINHC